MAWNRTNQPIFRTAFNPISGDTCQIVLGDAGLWNHNGVLKYRLADGSDMTVGGQSKVVLTNAQVLALRATPITLVAAPGAGFVLQLLSAWLIFDRAAAYTESADNLAIKYENGAGQAASETIETTGFLDAAADAFMPAKPVASAVILASAAANKALVLHNTGDGEFGGGNAANTLTVYTTYAIHTTGL